jgi:hypothetical protein
MVQRELTFRVFVSATFSDVKAERIRGEMMKAEE